MMQEALGDEIVLRQASVDDSELLLRWRNDLDTRMASRNTSPVDERTHRLWLLKVLSANKCRLLIAELAGVPVGTVRFDFDKDCEVSWTVDPKERGKGIGKWMVACAIRDMSLPLKATIRTNNIGSQEIAKSLGFEIINDDGEWQTLMLYPGSVAKRVKNHV
jgi:RimJ/RimL family protein N-acetyltransferase